MENRNYSVVTVALMTMLVLMGAYTMPNMGSVLRNPYNDSPAFAETETGKILADTDCTDEILPEMHAIYSKVDVDRAKYVADQNSELESRSQGFNAAFNSIFAEWSFDPATCGDLKLTSINVAYTLSDGQRDVKNVVVTFDPELSRITGVSIQQQSSTQLALARFGRAMSSRGIVVQRPPSMKARVLGISQL